MVQINFAQKQVNAKIVYYGPGMSGKTTNLEVVHQRAPEANRGDLTSISTDGDRTLFFDFMPLDLGTVAGMRTCFQIYTVPGQVYYNSTRKLVLQGVDGVIFVADSSASMQEENLESMRNLEENLNEYGKSLANLPIVIQYNKRDLPDAMSVEDLNQLLNQYNAPHFEAVASSGQGVFPTLKALAARVLDSIHTSQGAGGAGGGGFQSPAAPPVQGASTGFYPAGQGAPQGQPTQPAQPMGAPAQPAMGAPRMPAAAPAVAAQAPQQPAQGLPQMQQPAPGQPALGQTGFHPPQQAGGFPQGQPMSQTGFHPQQQQQPLGQTGFRPAGPQGGVDPLARTAVHAPPTMQGGQPMPPAQQPQAQGQAGLRMAPAAQPAPHAGMPQQAPAPGSAPMMQMDAGPSQRAAPAPAPAPAGRAPQQQRPQNEAPRIQPRSAASPTPVKKPKSRALMYAGIFLVFALGAGAVIGRFILKVF